MGHFTTIPTYPIDLESHLIDLVTAERWDADYSHRDWWNRPSERVTPEPGERWSYGDTTPATRQTASHVMIRYAGYSDYSGSTVEASNHRSLLRDFPDRFVDLYGDYGSRGLLLPVSCLDDAVLEALAALADYPAYDDEDVSALETEWVQAAISDYLRADMTHDLDRADREGEAEALRATDDDELSEHVWEFYSAAGEYPHAEAVETIVFPDSDELQEHVVDAILTRWAAAIAAPADGQTVLSDELS